jgi:hypothetical protein
MLVRLGAKTTLKTNKIVKKVFLSLALSPVWLCLWFYSAAIRDILDGHINVVHLSSVRGEIKKFSLRRFRSHRHDARQTLLKGEWKVH